MRKLTATICLILALFMVSSCGESDDYQKGLTAYESGDYAAALREWKPLAEQGNARAQYYLGGMYRGGRGVPKEYKTAVKWFTLSAQQWGVAAQTECRDSMWAQFNLGEMYAKGQGVLRDYVRAYMWGNIADLNCHPEAREFVDVVAKRLTPSQLEKALDLARECVRKKYKGC